MSSTGELEREALGRVERAEADEREPDGPIDRTTASLGLWPWAQLGVQNGVTLERFCEQTGIEVSAMRDPGVRFSQPVADRVAEVAYAQFGPGAAMLAALTIEAGHFNLLELIARTAPTVHDGLTQGCRFFPLLHHGGYLRYERLASGGGVLRWLPPQGYPVHRGYVELTFAVALLGIRRETGAETLPLDAISFRHEAPDDTGLHTRVLGVLPRFGMPEDHVIFSAEALALSLTRNNAAVHHAARRAGSDLLPE
jgi:hypothetical protein